MKLYQIINWLCRQIFVGGLLLLLCIYQSGCTFDESGIPPDMDWYVCNTDLWHCQREPDIKPDITLSAGQGSSVDTDPSTNAISYPILADKTKTYPIYHDEDVVIYSISDGELKGSLLIPAGYAEGRNADPEYWKIEFNNEIEEVYIAYDSRANLPAWLQNDYERYKKRDAQITTSILDPTSTSGYPRYLKLNLYRYKQPLTGGERIVIPGNSFDEPDIKDWKELNGEEPLMYAVLVEPKANWDCSNGFKRDTIAYKGCFRRIRDTLIDPDPEKVAMREWNWKYPFNAKLNINCKTTTDCTSANTLIGGALKMKGHAYLYSSEIEFVQPSNAIVTIGNDSYDQKVRGQLHFEYQLKTHDMRVNSMRLSIDPFSCGQGDFSDIEIYLLETSTAHCQGFPVSNLPCNQYMLKPSTFFCVENFKRNGKPHLFISENSTSMPIYIDHNSRSFTIKGNLASSARINGDTLPIDVDLNLIGKFVNFAPMPVADESDTFSQCVEGTNMNPIQLNAAGSYDVYEPLPTHQAAYNWIEDYGTLTEKLWGKGKSLKINQKQLAFGAHDITLMVEDAHGVAADTMLRVEVADTIPPSFKVPADVMMLFLEDPGPVKVNIGKAYASDMCTSNVLVTNDAPEDLRFPSGQMTKVTWHAEDLRGNVVTGTQQIHVMVMKPFRFHLDQAIYLISEGLKQARLDLSLAGDADRCFVDIAPIANGLDQVIDLSFSVELPEQQKNAVLEIASRLKPVRESLAETQRLIDRSNDEEFERAELRESARRSVEVALDLLPAIGPR